MRFSKKKFNTPANNAVAGRGSTFRASSFTFTEQGVGGAPPPVTTFFYVDDSSNPYVDDSTDSYVAITS